MNDELREIIETNRITNLIENSRVGNTRDSINKVSEVYNKPRIKNKPERETRGVFRLSGRTLKIIASIGAAAIGISAIASCTAREDRTDTGIGSEQSSLSENVETTNNIPAIPVPEELDKYTVEGVRQDFIQLFLEKYNEKYKTDYTDASFQVVYLKEGAVYKTADGKLVTRGSYPDETKEKIAQYNESIGANGDVGKIEIEYGHEAVCQIYVKNYEGDTIPLGTYDSRTGKFINSGNSQDLIKALQTGKYDIPTLEALGIPKEVLKAVGEVIKGQESESQESINKRISAYYGAIRDAEGKQYGDD